MRLRLSMITHSWGVSCSAMFIRWLVRLEARGFKYNDWESFYKQTVGRRSTVVDEKSVENIRKYGIAVGTGERKRQILVEEVGFPIGGATENVIITGCFQPEGMPHVFHAFKNVLDHFKIDYTLLDKEYCCGWMPIGQPAVIAKKEEDIARFKEISKEFIVDNFRQAKNLGAKSIVLFCGACEPNYPNYRDLTALEVIPYHELIDRYFKVGKLERKII